MSLVNDDSGGNAAEEARSGDGWAAACGGWLLGPGSSHSQSGGARRTIPLVFLAILLTVYFLAQLWNFSCGYLEPDPDGYFFLAKRLARGMELGAQQTSPLQYHQHLWVENPEGKILPKFAPGYSALLAIGYLIGGDRGMFWVSPVVGGLTLLGCFFLFRLWMSSLFSLLGVATLMVNWYFFFFSSYPLTHVSDLCMTTWGMYCMWVWHKRPAVGSGILAGLFLGAAAAMRYSSAVFVLVPAVAILAVFVRRRRSGSYPWGAIIALAAGWLICPALMMLYNYVNFGNPMLTGYALSDEQTAFGVNFMQQNVHLLNGGLYREVMPFIFPLGLAGILLVGNLSDRLMKLMWFLPLYLTYCSYYWAKPNASYLRFLMDVIPLFIGSTFVLIEHVNARRGVQRVAGVTVAAIAISIAAPTITQVAKGNVFRATEREFSNRAELVVQNVDPDAVILTRHPFCNHLGVRKSIEVYDLRVFTREYGAQEFRDPDEVKKQRTVDQPARRQPGRTRKFARFYEEASKDLLKHMKRDVVLSALREGRQVILLLPVAEAPTEAQSIGTDIRLRVLASWEPTDPNPNSMWGREWAMYELSQAM